MATVDETPNSFITWVRPGVYMEDERVLIRVSAYSRATQISTYVMKAMLAAVR